MKLWIARDKDDSLYLYYEKPYKCRTLFLCDMDNGMWLDRTQFPEVTFENSPQQVELKLVNEFVGVAESPSKTFPRVNEFETGASYRR